MVGHELINGYISPRLPFKTLPHIYFNMKHTVSIFPFGDDNTGKIYVHIHVYTFVSLIVCGCALRRVFLY